MEWSAAGSAGTASNTARSARGPRAGAAQRGGELRLPARALQEHHQRLRDLPRQLARRGRPRPGPAPGRSPRVTPAEVNSVPSRTKIASGSTVIAGYARPSSPACRQWVVARRPSSSPAAARTKAPVQIEQTRPDRAASARDGVAAAPASIGCVGEHVTAGDQQRVERAGRRVGGVERRPGSPCRSRTHRPRRRRDTAPARSGAPIRFASVNTSLGPATSSSFTPSKTTTPTRCDRRLRATIRPPMARAVCPDLVVKHGRPRGARRRPRSTLDVDRNPCERCRTHDRDDRRHHRSRTPPWPARPPTWSVRPPPRCCSTTPAGCSSSAACKGRDRGLEARPRAALRRRDVPRPRPDRALPPHRPALRGRRRRRGARDFLLDHGRSAGRGPRPVWLAIALHTTPGSPTTSSRRSRWSPPASRPTCSAWTSTRSRRRAGAVVGRAPAAGLQEPDPAAFTDGHEGPPRHHLRHR